MSEELPDLAAVMQGRKHEGYIRNQKLKRVCSERLSENCSSKVRTAFIGAIASFEASFGILWGHGKEVSACTEEQIAFRKVWGECRTSVLTMGNNQVRAMRSEIRQYEVLWNGHHLDLEVKGSTDDCK